MAMHLPVATLFIAKAAGVHLSAGQSALLFVMLMVTSKGAAACRDRR